MLLPGKSESIYHVKWHSTLPFSMWSAIRSLCERCELTLVPTTVLKDFEVDMHTVLKNAQCTFKNEF